jgi:SAM-dependent methyltransferase
MATLAQCYLCGSGEFSQIYDRCRDAPDVKVMLCRNCGLVFLSDSRAISEEFYEKSGMYEFEVPDREALLKEEEGDTLRRVSALSPLLSGKRYLDFGCGAGAVALGVRKFCADAAVVELNRFHREALNGVGGLRVSSSLSGLAGQFDLVTLFHVLEHLPDPISTLAEIRERLAPGGKVIVEVPHAKDALISRYDLDSFKAATYWSCHLYLFTSETLNLVFQKAGFSGADVQFVQRYPLANHLYWLAKGKPGGHKLWKDLSTPALDAGYAANLAKLELSDTLWAQGNVP